MKTKYYLFIPLLFIILSCEKEAPTSTDISGRWHLLNFVSTYFSSLACQFEPEEVIWDFGPTMLTIEQNTADQASNCVEFSTGTFSYEIIHARDKRFLMVDSVEFGEIVLENNTLHINGNSRSTGLVADGAFYLLSR